MQYHSPPKTLHSEIAALILTQLQACLFRCSKAANFRCNLLKSCLYVMIYHITIIQSHNLFSWCDNRQFLISYKKLPQVKRSSFWLSWIRLSQSGYKIIYLWLEIIKEMLIKAKQTLHFNRRIPRLKKMHIGIIYQIRLYLWKKPNIIITSNIVLVW